MFIVGIYFKMLDESWIFQVCSKICGNYVPKKRNINGDSKNDKDRYIVCVRWNFIKEDIINFKKNKF